MIYDCKLYLDREEFCKRQNFVDDEKVRTIKNGQVTQCNQGKHICICQNDLTRFDRLEILQIGITVN